MIISASRRTDVPAFYAEWLMRRVQAGWCEVANPFNPAQVTRVSLLPDEAEVLVFWTRDARPLLRHLPELDARGYRYYVQYTLTGYPRELEPAAPPVAAALETLARLAEHVGPARVVWRYDPILFTALTPPSYHAAQFARLAEALRGITCRVVISLADDYRRGTQRLQRLGLPAQAAPAEELPALLRGFTAAAAGSGMEIASCAETVDLRPFGIAPGKCIDDGLIRRAFSLDVAGGKDPSQRPACGCVPSKDIGAYDTCLHGCAYCYATHSLARAAARHAAHDPDAPALWR